MQVSVDTSLCEANGVCVGLAPSVFSLDDDEMLQVDQPVSDPAVQDRVTKAVARCPKGALSARLDDADH